VKQVKSAIPLILNLTNQIAGVMTHAHSISSNVDQLVVSARPIMTNLTLITSNLTNQHGSLGEWIITTNLNSQIELTLGTTRLTLTNLSATLTNASTTLTNLNATVATASTTLTNLNTTLFSANKFVGNADTNLTALLDNIGHSLDNLANLTSNLNLQVQRNPELVGELGHAITTADELMQGLKRHWLLRSAFKTNKPPATATPPRK
jgi:septation ring formation regulator EzrA